LASDGSIWVVDHGVCFSVEPKLRTVIWDFAGEPLPPSLTADLERVGGQLRSGELRQSMLGLLSKREVEAVAGRAQALVRAGCLPEPGSRRAYPWPPL
jgi:uncharacterized repeat protein (TIGR03843 family)